MRINKVVFIECVFFILFLHVAVVSSEAVIVSPKQKTPHASRDYTEVSRTDRVRGVSTQDLGSMGVAMCPYYGIPSGDVANIFNPAIGIDVYYILRKPFEEMKLPVDLVVSLGYVSYSGKVFSSDTFTVISPRILVRYDIALDDNPGKAFLFAGGGLAFESATVNSAASTNTDPVLAAGAGYETRLLEKLTGQFGIEYEWIIQRRIPGAARDASFFKFKAGLTYIIPESAGGRK